MARHFYFLLLFISVELFLKAEINMYMHNYSFLRELGLCVMAVIAFNVALISLKRVIKHDQNINGDKN